MGKTIAGMTISLDGFINDHQGSVSALYPDFDAMRESEFLQESIENTGAVLMGWNTYSMAEDPDWYAGNYEYQTPIFVVTHNIPNKLPRQTDKLTFTFVTEGIEAAVARATAAAGEKDVTVVGGASTVQQVLRAGLADELDIDIMPVLLGRGTRLFEALGNKPLLLERLNLITLPSGRTHLRFRIVK